VQPEHSEALSKYLLLSKLVLSPVEVKASPSFGDFRSHCLDLVLFQLCKNRFEPWLAGLPVNQLGQ